MKPVRTSASNLVYTSSDPDVRDLHCERTGPGQILSVWWLAPDERAAIAAGANIALWVLTEPIPPVVLTVTESQGVGEDAPELLARLEELTS